MAEKIEVVCNKCGAKNRKDRNAHFSKCPTCGFTTHYWIGPPRMT